MRQIKFRAWVEESEMWEVAGFAIDTTKEKIRLWRMNPDMPDGMGTEVFPLCNVELMQFSGLLDADGKEIYEGDVVYLAGVGNVEMKFPFTELYEAAQEGDIGNIRGNIHQSLNSWHKGNTNVQAC